MIKKVLFAVMFAALVAVTAQAAEKIKDVAADDWAAKSIQKMVDQGYIALYPENEFKGDKSISRKEFAVALAKLVDQLESGQFKAGGTEIQEIKQMSEQLNSNIAQYDARLTKLENRFTDISNQKVAIQIDLTKSVGEFRDNYDKLVAENEKLRADLAEQQKAVAELSVGLVKEGTARKKKDSTNLLVGILALVAGVAIK